MYGCLGLRVERKHKFLLMGTSNLDKEEGDTIGLEVTSCLCVQHLGIKVIDTQVLLVLHKHLLLHAFYFHIGLGQKLLQTVKQQKRLLYKNNTYLQS
jgi:hypothetical protein